jgi:hypothetical protein
MIGKNWCVVVGAYAMRGDMKSSAMKRDGTCINWITQVF